MKSTIVLPSLRSKLPVWTVVLAAGAGRRLSSLTGGVPKQFWAGPGGHSLLDETVRRFTPVSEDSRRVVIVGRTHRGLLGISKKSWGTTVYQPHDRGTAAGLLLAITPVLASDPNAIVVVTPSDHGVDDHARFLTGIDTAINKVFVEDRIVLFGVEPTSSFDDYGWILPGRRDRETAFRSIARFVEKPERAVADRLLRDGAIWNTMVLVGRAATIRDLCFEFLPELQTVFTDALALPEQERDLFLDAAYRTLPAKDFSRDVLSKALGLVTYIWPATIGWSDLGTPERMFAWLNRSRASVGANEVTAA